MAYKKKEESGNISKARTRLAGMKQIDTNKGRIVNYGDEDRIITSEELENNLKSYAEKLEDYNQLLQQADKTSNELDELETKIKNIYSSVLKSAQGRFGSDAFEIEILGGTRISDRKSPNKVTGLKN